LRSHLHQEAVVAERIEEAEAVIRRGRTRDRRIATEIEGARIDDGAANRRSVTPDELRRRVNDDLGAPIDGAAEIGRRKGVIDDEGYSAAFGHRRETLDIQDAALGISDGLSIRSEE